MTYPADLLNRCRLLAAPCDATGLRIVEPFAAIHRRRRPSPGRSPSGSMIQVPSFECCAQTLSQSPIEATTFSSTQSSAGAQHTVVGGLSAATAGNPRSIRNTRHSGEPRVSGRVARSHTRPRKGKSCGRPYDRVEAPGRLSQQEAEEVRRIVGE
ncbi:unnamed protein product [Stenotrophomonas maltophilia]|nr:unnamed protein product [Stenotrophomonas maltophilia]